jgi:hypothetical protein
MRNEDILAPLMSEIAQLRAAGREWRQIGQMLEERGVVAASGIPFTVAALRTYCSNYSRPKEAPVSQQLAELEAALKAEKDARLAAEYQRHRLAKMMAEYLISRIQWTRGILAVGKRDIGLAYLNHQRQARELRTFIEDISSDAAGVADRAGELITLLCLDLAAEPNMQISASELSELRLSDQEDLRRFVRREYFAGNDRWELSMAAATPPPR